MTADEYRALAKKVQEHKANKHKYLVEKELDNFFKVIQTGEFWNGQESVNFPGAPEASRSVYDEVVRTLTKYGYKAKVTVKECGDFRFGPSDSFGFKVFNPELYQL